MTAEFRAFPKLARLSREVVITEKLDGTNACVVILDRRDATDSEKLLAELGDFHVYAQSRTRMIAPGDDNFGFAAWVRDNARELAKLGAGYHFGEWWGRGIQRGYGLTDRRFSLFNVARWSDDAVRPACCSVVPTLYRGVFDTHNVEHVLAALKFGGSVAAPGFMQPEGVIIYHTAANVMFKKTFDDNPKGQR